MLNLLGKLSANYLLGNRNNFKGDLLFLNMNKRALIAGGILISLVLFGVLFYNFRFTNFALQEGDDSKVTRSFSNTTYLLNESLTVQISVFVELDFGHQLYIVEENVPSEISIINSGEATQVGNVLKWAGVSDSEISSVNLTYTIQVPESAGSGPLTFTGFYGFDQMENSVDIGGENSISLFQVAIVDSSATSTTSSSSGSSGGGGGGGGGTSPSSNVGTDVETDDQINYSLTSGSETNDSIEGTSEESTIENQSDGEAKNLFSKMVGIIFISLCLVILAIIVAVGKHRHHEIH